MFPALQHFVMMARADFSKRIDFFVGELELGRRWTRVVNMGASIAARMETYPGRREPKNSTKSLQA